MLRAKWADDSSGSVEQRWSETTKLRFELAERTRKEAQEHFDRFARELSDPKGEDGR